MGLAQNYKEDVEFLRSLRKDTEPSDRKSFLSYYYDKLFLPQRSFRLTLLHGNNSVSIAGHLEFSKTIKRIFSVFYPKNLRKDYTKYFISCPRKTNKLLNQKLARNLRPLEPPSIKWTHITTNFIALLPISSKGNIVINTVVNRLSKMTRSNPFKPISDNA